MSVEHSVETIELSKTRREPVGKDWNDEELELAGGYSLFEYSLFIHSFWSWYSPPGPIAILQSEHTLLYAGHSMNCIHYLRFPEPLHPTVL